MLFWNWGKMLLSLSAASVNIVCLFALKAAFGAIRMESNLIKKGNEGRTLLYYMILPTGRKLVDSQGDPTAGTLKATASEVRPVE